MVGPDFRKKVDSTLEAKKSKKRKRNIRVQADLVIRGLFISEFAYSHMKYSSRRPNSSQNVYI